MSDQTRSALVGDILDGLAHGKVAGSTRDMKVEPRDDGLVLEVDTGDPSVVYLVTVASVDRVE